MFELNRLPLARLDLPPRGIVTGRPEHQDGLTVTAGRCGHPMSGSTLCQVTSVVEHPEPTEAESAAERAAAELAGQVAAAVEAAVGRSAAFATSQRATAAASEAHTALTAASADLDDVKAAIATALAARPPRDTSAIRPAVAAAGAAKHRARLEADRLSAESHVARVALDGFRGRVRAEVVAERARGLADRRDVLRARVVAALEEIAAELLCVDAQTRALGIDPSAPLPARTPPATSSERASPVPGASAVAGFVAVPRRAPARASAKSPGRPVGSASDRGRNVEDALLDDGTSEPDADADAMPVEDEVPTATARS